MRRSWIRNHALIYDQPTTPTESMKPTSKSKVNGATSTGFCYKNSLIIQDVGVRTRGSPLWNVAKIFFATEPYSLKEKVRHAHRHRTTRRNDRRHEVAASRPAHGLCRGLRRRQGTHPQRGGGHPGQERMRRIRDS